LAGDNPAGTTTFTVGKCSNRRPPGGLDQRVTLACFTGICIRINAFDCADRLFVVEVLFFRKMFFDRSFLLVMRELTSKSKPDKALLPGG
jgi:hypothetical protein